MNGSVRYIMYVFLAILALFWMRAGWILFYPYTPLVIHSLTIEDDDQIVEAGSPLYYKVNFRKNMDLPATLVRRLVNSVVITLPSMEVNNPPGEYTVKAGTEIPAFADAGTYTLRCTYTYVIGGWPERRISVEAVSPPFKVVRKEDAEITALKNSLINNSVAIGDMKMKQRKDEDVIKRHREKSSYDRVR